MYGEQAANHGLEAIMMCPCRFINYNKCTAVVGVVGNKRETMYVCGQRVYGQYLHLALIFCYKSKITLKN
jgi:hypothetical protein